MSGASDDVQSIANCRVCQRSGLPILPLRYAVTRTDGGDQAGHPPGPEIHGPLIDETVRGINLPDGQHYTMRLLREGYLYVFNELRGRWTGYTVTEKGYLIEYVDLSHDVVSSLDPDKPQPIDGRLEPPAEKQEFACNSSPDHVHPGRCVMIPDADKAGDVYFVFSEVAWTKRVWKKYAVNENSRREYMRKISLSDWRGKQGEHIDSLDKVEEYLAEAKYRWVPPSHSNNSAPSEGDDGESTAFSSSPFSMNGMREQVEPLSSWARLQAQPLNMDAAVIGLVDPVAVAMEIKELSRERVLDWTSEPDRKRKHESAVMIQTVKAAVENGAEAATAESRSMLMGVLGAIMPAHVGAAYGGQPGLSGVARAMDEAKKLSEDDINLVHERAWEKYKERYDFSAHETFLKVEYPTQLNEFEEKLSNPLDRAYVDWLESSPLKNGFKHNYDRKSISSGVFYVMALYRLIKDASYSKIVFSYLEKCLGDDPENDDAILSRGFCFNNDSLVASWSSIGGSAYEPQGGWDGVASSLWGAINSALGGFTDRQRKDAMKTLSHYTYEYSGALIKKLQQVYDMSSGEMVASSSEIRVVAMLGGVAKGYNTNYRLVEVEARATGQQIKKITQNLVRGISGEVRYNGPSEVGAVFDPIDERYTYKGLLLVESQTEFSVSIKMTAEELDGYAQSTIRRMTNLEAGGHFVSAMLAIYSFGSTWDEFSKKASVKSIAGLSSGLTTIAGSLMEGAGAALRNTAFGSAELARTFQISQTAISTRAAGIGAAGKLVGTIGAVISGVLMFWDGLENRNVSPLYGYSTMALGVSMFLVGVITFFAGTGVGIVLSLIISAIMVAVGFLRPDEVDKWLDKTIFFGEHRDGSFSNISAQRESMLAMSDGNEED
ncbi:T6SS effector BTH_I2691 family protein [Salinicola endophyticus]|uniref:T6SS effector BTH_I2691 family protein n=1 Tax=Salinicola endophyticus TaxID=1949083 RepID=UPI0013006871|nr:T6SS effector BTH_I2691 family protein [Salinicola endophyticus]